MSLGLNDPYSSPTIDLDLGAPVTTESLAAQTQPSAKANGSSGFNVSDAVSSLLGLLDGGFKVYQSVQQKIGQAQVSKAEQKTAVAQIAAPAAQPTIAFGLTTNQWLLIGGGLVALLVVPRILRRA